VCGCVDLCVCVRVCMCGRARVCGCVRVYVCVRARACLCVHAHGKLVVLRSKLQNGGCKFCSRGIKGGGAQCEYDLM